MHCKNLKVVKNLFLIRLKTKSFKRWVGDENKFIKCGKPRQILIAMNISAAALRYDRKKCFQSKFVLLDLKVSIGTLRMLKC